MKKIDIFQVDAFSEKVFGGNPAAVCLLDEWLTNEQMVSVAAENNLSETAFLIKENPDKYRIRYFTPTSEIDLCGHATLASAFVVFHQDSSLTRVAFEYNEGVLFIEKKSDEFEMLLPSWEERHEVSQKLKDRISQQIIKAPIVELFKTRDLVCVIPDEYEITQIEPNFDLIKELDVAGVIITQRGKGADVVSRGFFPSLGILEDPVTGSSSCSLVPYWRRKLGKDDLLLHQASKRGGYLKCRYTESGIFVSGQCALYLKGSIFL